MSAARVLQMILGPSFGSIPIMAGLSKPASVKRVKIQMATKQITVQRFSLTTSKSFREVVAGLESRIGHPDMQTFRSDLAAAGNDEDLERIVQDATGPSGLMEFARFDLGEVLRKELGTRAPQTLRLVVGNPVIMKQMVKYVPDAGSYAPVTILIEEREDGVHISYDEMASYLAPYGSREALHVAKELDSKVEAILIAAAR
jgi:uncharacterized protein (DUF302 family)